MGIFLLICLPILIPYLALSTKRRPIILQRLGIIRPSPKIRQIAKKPIWVHALSVGEVMATVPLLKAMRNHYPDRPVVFSASTRSGQNVAQDKLQNLVDGIFFFPYDLSFSVKRIVSYIRPSLVIIVETDIWPNFLSEIKDRNVPIVLANAKLSNRSYVGYRRILTLSRQVISSFTAIGCQSHEDAERFRQLGIPDDIISVTGNIKFDQNVSPLPKNDLDILREFLSINRHQLVWIAGSTHDGEETIIRQAFAMLKKEFSDLVLVVAPRHPERASSVARIFNLAGFSSATLSERTKGNSQKTADVIIIDTLGMLKKLYALADVALVGGSLIHIRGIGGHNPLEPAAFAKPILFGPQMHNFSEIAKMLTKARGAIQVTDPGSIYAAVQDILKNHKRAQDMGRSARLVFDSNKGAVMKTMAIVSGQLVSSAYRPSVH
jgi:3-deoxy-D-manno-octulosonic-acid transferase